MKTTFFDRVAAMLIALLILGGLSVSILFGLWLSAQVFARPHAVPVSLVPRGDGAGMDDVGQSDPNVIEPGAEFEQNEPSLLDSLESVVNIVSQQSAFFADISPMDDSLLIPSGRQGDGRVKGDGIGIVGRVRRWEFNFDRGMTATDYARMLDEFGIELGVLRPGGKVIYVSHLSADKPDVREGASAEEIRYYLTWLKGDTENADREILGKAGVQNQGQLILKFLPPPLEAELEAQERAYAKEREQDIRGSFFRVIMENGKHKFYLYHQLYQ